MKFKFRALVNRHQDQVYSLAQYILRDGAEAEDVTQEVYTRLWKNIETVETDIAKAWLMQVTRNLCIDHLRARRNEKDISELELMNNDTKREPATALAQSQLSQWLRNSIEKLKEPYRSLIVLNYIHQKNHREIAASQSLSTNQVKVYMHRARQQLRTLLYEVEL